MTGRTAEAPPRLAARYSATRVFDINDFDETLSGPRNGTSNRLPRMRDDERCWRCLDRGKTGLQLALYRPEC